MLMNYYLFTLLKELSDSLLHEKGALCDKERKELVLNGDNQPEFLAKVDYRGAQFRLYYLNSDDEIDAYQVNLDKSNHSVLNESNSYKYECVDSFNVIFANENDALNFICISQKLLSDISVDAYVHLVLAIQKDYQTF